MKRMFVLVNIMLSFFNLNCNSQQNAIEDDCLEMFFNKKTVIEDLENYHIGHCDIDSGILIAQVFDKSTRQNRKIYLANLITKERYGFFPWPDPQNSFYFGVAYSNGSLIYFNDHKSFKLFDLKTRKRDTIPIASDISEFTGMVAVNGNIYSIGNIYGIDMVRLRDSLKHVRLNPYQGSYYSEQNNISLPVNNLINLVASSNSSPDKYKIYAIDSNLTTRWQKEITLQNRFLQIKSVSLLNDYLIKYDNRIELLSKIDGKLKWSEIFEKNVYDLYLQRPGKVLIILSKKSTGNIGIDNSNNLSEILQYNVDSRIVEWRTFFSYQKTGFFVSANDVFQFGINGESIKISVTNGAVEKFSCLNKVDVVRDRLTGQSFAKKDNAFYW